MSASWVDVRNPATKLTWVALVNIPICVLWYTYLGRLLTKGALPMCEVEARGKYGIHKLQTGGLKDSQQEHNKSCSETFSSVKLREATSNADGPALMAVLTGQDV